MIRRHPYIALLAACVALVVVIRLAWGWQVSWQLGTRLDAIRAAGQPTRLSEVSLDTVADDANAWRLFQHAAAAMKPGVDSPRASVEEYPPYPPHGPVWEKLAAASESAHGGPGGAFALARDARKFERSSLRDGSIDLSNAIAVRSYSPARDLANALVDGAMHRHLNDDDAEAVERLRDTLHLGRALRRDPFIISSLVADAIYALALDATQMIAPTLDVGSGAKGEASREQVHALIAELLDDRGATEQLVRTLHSERAFILDLLTLQSAGTRVVRPLAERTKVRWVDGFETLVAAAEAPNYAAAKQLLATLEADWPKPFKFAVLLGSVPPLEVPRYSRWFAEYGPGSLARFLEQHYRVLAERRVTAISLAARLYRVDHDGRWPDTLDALVPAYLPAVPVDPFRADGGPVGYAVHRNALPDGSDRAVVYFAAIGAPDPGLDTEPMFGWQLDRAYERPGGRYDDGDMRQYRDLALWLPAVRRFDEYQKASEASEASEAEGIIEY